MIFDADPDANPGWIQDGSRMDRGWIEDGSGMDRRWIEDGSRMDRGWIEDESRMDRGWIEDGLGMEQPPTPPHRKKISQGWPQKEDYLWFFARGWSAGYVSIVMQVDLCRSAFDSNTPRSRRISDAPMGGIFAHVAYEHVGV